MKATHARAIAADWVMRHEAVRSGFAGAYFIGSSVDLDGSDELPNASDVDVAIAVEGWSELPHRFKVAHRDVIIEVTYLSLEHLADRERVLHSYHLAAGLWRNTIICDPTGYLQKLHTLVAGLYQYEEQVRERCAGALHKVEDGLAGVREDATFADQVLAWVFPTGVTTHVLLTAGLRNPTVRLRYGSVRALLAEYSMNDVYLQLLDLLGVTSVSSHRMLRHVDALERAFNTAVATPHRPLPFDADISSLGRPAAVNSLRTLVESGRPDEAAFWVIVTFARCCKVFHEATRPRSSLASHIGAFRALTSDLGIGTLDDMRVRSAKVRDLLPDLRDASEQIIKANPDVIHE